MNPNPHPGSNDQPATPDSLGRVLSALNSAAPPTGMEQRILQAVELRLSAEPIAHAPGFHWLRRLHVAPTTAFAAALAFLVLAFVHLFQAHPARKPQPKVTATEKSAPFKGPSLRLDHATVHKMDPMPKPVLDAAGVPLPVSHPPAQKPPQPTFFLVAALAPPPPVAATEAAATPLSFPAPPMPLTQQEKLLLRIAHRNDPQSLDALIPEKRAAREAEDNNEFETFFPKPKPVEYPALLLSQVNQPAVPLTQIHGDK